MITEQNIKARSAGSFSLSTLLHAALFVYLMLMPQTRPDILGDSAAKGDGSVTMEISAAPGSGSDTTAAGGDKLMVAANDPSGVAVGSTGGAQNRASAPAPSQAPLPPPAPIHNPAPLLAADKPTPSAISVPQPAPEIKPEPPPVQPAPVVKVTKPAPAKVAADLPQQPPEPSPIEGDIPTPAKPLVKPVVNAAAKPRVAKVRPVKIKATENLEEPSQVELPAQSTELPSAAKTVTEPTPETESVPEKPLPRQVKIAAMPESQKSAPQLTEDEGAGALESPHPTPSKSESKAVEPIRSAAQTQVVPVGPKADAPGNDAGKVESAQNGDGDGESSGKNATAASGSKLASQSPGGTGNESSTGGRSGGIPNGAEVRDADGLAERPGNLKPNYPQRDRLSGYEGTVVVVGKVLADGSVERVILQKKSGSASMDDAAVKAFKKWKFMPGQEGYAFKAFDFHLTGEAKEITGRLNTVN